MSWTLVFQLCLLWLLFIGAIAIVIGELKSKSGGGKS